MAAAKSLEASAWQPLAAHCQHMSSGEEPRCLIMTAPRDEDLCVDASRLPIKLVEKPIGSCKKPCSLSIETPRELMTPKREAQRRLNQGFQALDCHLLSDLQWHASV